MISSREREVKVKVIDDTEDRYRIRLETTDGLEILTIKVTKEHNDPDFPNWFITKAEIERGTPTESTPDYRSSLGGSDFLKTEATVDGDNVTLRVYNEVAELFEIQCNYVNNTAKITKIAEIDVEDPEPEPEPGIDEEILCEENAEPAQFATVVASDGLAEDPQDYMLIFEIANRKKYFEIMRDVSSPNDITKLYTLFYETLRPRYVIALSELPEEISERLFSGEDVPLYALFEELGLGDYVHSIDEVLSEAPDEFKNFYIRVLKALKQVYFKMPNEFNTNDYDIVFSDIVVSKNFIEEDIEVTYDEISFFPGQLPNDDRDTKKYVDPDFCVLDFINSGIDGSGDTPEPQDVDKYYIIDIRSIDSDPTGQEVNIVLNGELVGYTQQTEIDVEPEIVGFNFINKQFMAKVGDEISFVLTNCQEEHGYIYNASEAGILNGYVYGGTLVGNGGHIVISFGKTQE